MKKNILLLFLIASVPYLNAQVGINTTNPNPSSALDITSDKLGVLIPRVSLTSANDTTTVINASSGKYENGLLVYNTTATGGLTPGFYYWQGTQWTRINDSGIITEPWQIQGTTNPATSNTDNIYQTGSVAIGKNVVVSNTDGSGNKTSAMLDVKGAIRGGDVQSNRGIIGLNSIAVGTKVSATAEGAAAFGQGASATGIGSLAIGRSTGTTASGDASFAMGTNAVAKDHYSFAFGNGAQTQGSHTFAFGSGAKALSGGAFAFGTNAVVNSSIGIAFAFGNNVNINGSSTYSFGFGNNISNASFNSFTFGQNATVGTTSDFSLAFGNQVQNNGLSSAPSNYSFAFGNSSANNNAQYSLAFGNTTTNVGTATAPGSYAFAFGDHITTATPRQVAFGSYNENVTNAAFEIANGTVATKKNLITLLNTGNFGIGITPTSTLDVNGAVTLRKDLIVSNGSGTAGQVLTSQGAGNAPQWTTVSGGGGGGNASGTWTTAVGLGSSASGMQTVAIGYGASASGNNVVAIGAGASSSQDNSFILGNNIMKVGIRTQTPTEALDVNGNIKASGTITQNSDLRYKKDLQKLQEILPLLDKLNAYTYFFKTDEFKDKNFSDKKQIGMIAQEVEKVFPELVSADAKGYKSLNYVQFTAVLLEAVKELNSKVSTLEIRQTNTEQEINSIKQQITILKQ